MSICSSMAIVSSVHLRYHSPKSAGRLISLLAAFPEALSYSCLSGSIPLSNVVLQNMPNVTVQHRDNLEPAIALCYHMHDAVRDAAVESSTSSSSYVEALHLNEVSHSIDKLVDCHTGCEKIVRTPVPLSYSRHTSRFLTVFCGSLPFALVATLGWLTLPVVFITCTALFGIEEIGHLIEQPFVAPKNLVDRKEPTFPYDIGLPVIDLAGEVRAKVESINKWPNLNSEE